MDFYRPMAIPIENYECPEMADLGCSSKFGELTESPYHAPIGNLMYLMIGISQDISLQLQSLSNSAKVQSKFTGLW